MIDGWITQLRKGVLEYGVLLALRRGESYGYELVQALRRSEDLAVSESTVYPILARLRQEVYHTATAEPYALALPRALPTLPPRGKVRLAEMNAYWPMLTNALEQLKSEKGKESES